MLERQDAAQLAQDARGRDSEAQIQGAFGESAVIMAQPLEQQRALGYHELRAMLNLYGAARRIQF